MVDVPEGDRDEEGFDWFIDDEEALEAEGDKRNAAEKVDAEFCGSPDILSQDEIDALLMGTETDEQPGAQLSHYLVLEPVDGPPAAVWERSGEVAEGVYALVETGGVIYAGTEKGIARSLDAGATWRSVYAAAGVVSLAAVGEALYALSRHSSDPLIRSVDGGETWQVVKTGLGKGGIRALAALGGSLYVGTEDGLFRAAFGGSCGELPSAPTAGDLTPLFARSMADATPVRQERLARLAEHLQVERAEEAPADDGSRELLDSGETPAEGDETPGAGDSLEAQMLGAMERENGSAETVAERTVPALRWEPVDTLYRATVRTLVAAPDGCLYAGTQYSGLFCSGDNGQTWKQTEFPHPTVTALAASGQQLYACSERDSISGHIFRSTDGGRTWTELNAELRVTAMLVVDGVVYAGVGDGFADEGGIYYSADGGQTWIRAAGPEYYTGSFAVLAGTLYAGTSRGTYQSGDRGHTWHKLECPHADALAVLDAALYVGAVEGLFRSADGGRTWEGLGLSDEYITSLAVSGAALYAGTAAGVLRSADGGRTWRKRSGWDCYVYKLIALGSAVYAGTADGIFSSADGGETWTQAVLPELAVDELLFSERVFFVSSFPRIFGSTDGGETWAEVALGVPQRRIKSLVMHRGAVYASSWGVERAADATTAVRSEVYLSQDCGQTWEGVGDGLPEVEIHRLRASERALYAHTAAGVYRSLDGGQTWTGVPIDAEDDQILVQAVADTGLYAATNSAVYCLKDSAQRWTRLVWPGVTLGSQLAPEQMLCLGRRGGVAFSRDGGATWIDAPVPDLNPRAIVETAAGLFLGTLGGVFHSSGDGESWTAVNEGLSCPRVRFLAVSGTTLYAGTDGGGIFRASLENSGDEGHNLVGRA